MDIILKNMFNDGVNDGDLEIITRDGQIRMHSFVLISCSEYYKNYVNDLTEQKLIGEQSKLDLTNYKFANMETLKTVLCVLYDSNDIKYPSSWRSVTKLYNLIEFLLINDKIICRFEKILDKFTDELNTRNDLHTLHFYDENKQIKLCEWLNILIILGDSDNKYLNKLRNIIYNRCKSQFVYMLYIYKQRPILSCIPIEIIQLMETMVKNDNTFENNLFSKIDGI